MQQNEYRVTIVSENNVNYIKISEAFTYNSQ